MLGITHFSVHNIPTAFTVVTGLVALSLLVVTIVLPQRVPSILSSFGLEWVLRSHRLLGVLVVLLVVLHLVCVFIGDPRGLTVLNLSHQPKPVWAATASTLALLLLVAFAAMRRMRQPRYEAWRMIHFGLALTAAVFAGLHVWWLHLLADKPEMRAWFVLLLVLMVAVLWRRWIWRPLRARGRAFAVEGVRPASGSAVTVSIRALGHRGLRFQAGQFAWLKIGSSPFVFEEHPFTIASAADQPHRMEFTVKALGDFSELMAGLRPGRRVYLDGPYGRFTVDGLRSSGFVFIAGGVGVTPILSILRTLANRGDRRPHMLLVGGHTIADLLMRQEIATLRRRLALTVVEAVDKPPPGWTGERGRIDAKLLDRRLPRGARHYDYFVSGPPKMVVSIGQHLRCRGIPVERIHTEQFEVV